MFEDFPEELDGLQYYCKYQLWTYYTRILKNARYLAGILKNC